MKYVGGFTRPGYLHALTDAELEKLPGYGRDITKAREEAKRLLKEAGVGNLKINFLNRNVGQPYTAAGIYAIDQWGKIGIETDHKQLETKLFYDALARGDFDVAIDFITDHGDDPKGAGRGGWAAIHRSSARAAAAQRHPARGAVPGLPGRTGAGASGRRRNDRYGAAVLL